MELPGRLEGSTVGELTPIVIDMRKQTFRSEDEIASALDLPVLAVVPAMLSEPEHRLRRRRRTHRFLYALIVCAIIGGIAAWAVFG